MYISLNWIKDFVDLEGLNIEEVVNKFTLSCAEVEDVIYKGKDVSGIITARIESIENHPNSTKTYKRINYSGYDGNASSAEDKGN